MQLAVFSPRNKVIPELSENIEAPLSTWSISRTPLSWTKKRLKPEIRIYLGRDVSLLADYKAEAWASSQEPKQKVKE
jgi:hypothetical protein